jgi:hypothetical protein
MYAFVCSCITSAHEDSKYVSTVLEKDDDSNERFLLLIIAVSYICVHVSSNIKQCVWCSECLWNFSVKFYNGVHGNQ